MEKKNDSFDNYILIIIVSIFTFIVLIGSIADRYFEMKKEEYNIEKLKLIQNK